MIEQIEEDTPIIRARLADLPSDKIYAMVEALQAKRLRAQTIYEEAKLAKQELTNNKNADLLVDKLEKFEKKLATVTSGVEALEKMAKDILGIRLALGI